MVTAASSRRRWHVPPAVILFLLAAMIGEALSGATPPAAFFLNPIVFVYLTVYYGSGALLVREFTRRWGKGWPTLLLLGGVWGVVQEGLGTKVFFDPTRTELGPLVNYGTWAGVHWAFVVQLFVYHSIYSIVLPIVLTDVLYWSERDRLWAGKPVLWICGLLQIAMTAVAYQTVSTYKPPAELSLATLAVTVGLILIARWLPSRSSDVEASSPFRHPLHRPRWFYLVGCLASAAFFFVSLVVPGWTSIPLVVILLMLIITAGTLWILRQGSEQGRAWSRAHQLALAAGLLTPLIVMSPAQEIGGLTGKSVVGLAAVALLWWMWRHVMSTRATERVAGAYG